MYLASEYVIKHIYVKRTSLNISTPIQYQLCMAMNLNLINNRRVECIITMNVVAMYLATYVVTFNFVLFTRKLSKDLIKVSFEAEVCTHVNFRCSCMYVCMYECETLPKVYIKVIFAILHIFVFTLTLQKKSLK